jgi:hypothetical protein
MNWQHIAILTASRSLILVAAVGVSGQTNSRVADLLEKRTLQIVGASAAECGRVTVWADPKKATDCALAADKAGKSFRVRYDLQGIDSSVAAAFVRLRDGTVQALSYDSDPSGGGHTMGGIIRVSQCPTPIHLYSTPKSHLTCFPPGSTDPFFGLL